MIKFGIDRPRTLQDLYMTTVAILAQAIIARALVAKPYLGVVLPLLGCFFAFLCLTVAWICRDMVAYYERSFDMN